jgi:hypothetical protein
VVIGPCADRAPASSLELKLGKEDEMLRVLFAGFLIAHGLVHPAVWATPKDPARPGPFDPGQHERDPRLGHRGRLHADRGSPAARRRLVGSPALT